MHFVTVIPIYNRIICKQIYLTVATNAYKSEPSRNGYEEALKISLSSRTGSSPSDAV